MNERIRELAAEASGKQSVGASDFADWKTLDKFAELIIKECIMLMENEKAMYADPGTYESREYYERMSAKEDAFDDAASTIRYHFGVK